MYFTHMMIAATRILCPAKFDLESRNSKLKSGKVAFRNVAKNRKMSRDKCLCLAPFQINSFDENKVYSSEISNYFP